VEGRPYRQNAPLTVVAFRAIAGGYLEAMGIRRMRGRSIVRADVDRGDRIVVINEVLADVVFPGQDPTGRHVASSKAPSRPGEAPSVTWLTIVGIVSNTTTATLAERRPVPTLYMPMSIAGGPGIPTVALVGPNVATMSYIVRSKSSPLALVPAVRRAIDGVDRSLAIADVRPLQDTLDRASAQMAFTMVLLAIAAAVALTLGVVGIYGAMSYIVSQRTGEVGLRLALGAEPTSITRMITRQGGLVALAGILAGLAAAFAGSRLIASLLYDISPRDPAVFGAAAVTLLAAALAACWLPARRAANINPLDALRAD
jgi:ABC-type antimicrobial peptide transport system permease subunit